MESIAQNFFFYNWPKKLIALITAIILWTMIDNSILATRTIPFVPIRVINLPEDKTIPGLLPNGVLTKRMTLTLTGTKDVIEKLEAGDFEVVVDVTNLSSEGTLQITKKNLVSLNPNLNLIANITQVSHPDVVIKMSPLLTEKIPITIHRPIGEPPKGYQYLDIWPITLWHQVTGPQEQVLTLKNKGLELTFNLNEITKGELDLLTSSQPDALYSDEISFPVPLAWKKTSIPFLNNFQEMINDPAARNLHISFLRQELIPLGAEIPIEVFYPLKTSAAINPTTYPIKIQEFVKSKYGITVLEVPLFALYASRLFVEVVKENLEINIVAVAPSEREALEWSVDFINPHHLENAYVAYMLSDTENMTSGDATEVRGQERESFFRQRFRNYMLNFQLYVSKEHELELDCSLQDHQVIVHIPYVKEAPSPSQEGQADAG